MDVFGHSYVLCLEMKMQEGAEGRWLAREDMKERQNETRQFFSLLFFSLCLGENKAF